MTIEEFREYLKDYKERNQLSYANMGKAAGINPYVLSKFMTGRTILKERNMMSLLKYLGLSHEFNSIFADKNRKTQPRPRKKDRFCEQLSKELRVIVNPLAVKVYKEDGVYCIEIKDVLLTWPAIKSKSIREIKNIAKRLRYEFLLRKSKEVG